MASPAAPRKPSARKRMFWMLLITLLVFGAVFGLKAVMNKGMNDFFDNMPMPPAVVTAAVAREATWADTEEVVGTLVAVNGTELTSEVGGVVERIHFQPGERVRKGQVLVELNSDNERAQLKALEATARLAVVQRERWRELGGQNLVSRAEVDERVGQAATALAQADAQRALIAKKTIRAPFDGELGIRRISLGQYINPGAPLVMLQAVDPILVNFALPEQRLGQVSPGQPIRLSVDAQPGRSFEGTVTAIEPAVDPSTRNFTVQARLSNPEGVLRPGTFARVSLDLGQPRKVVVIPQTAVSFNPYSNAVWVLSPAPKRAQPQAEGQPAGPAPEFVVKQRFVKTGATRGDLIAVLDGLKPGERVASSGLLKLRPDMPVIVNNKVTPSADATPDVENR
ncbi:efflux RND transporter periplasmic adaptor subunit [Vulcaniibacterium thermophilum]|uniref:MexH family multidrug efflux RND transporter periplasmic adaptor subunit n=1 Tax=Vulcaniibacterium thermophilum TaxID=1169913 RepID=A0A918YYR3_9GAMM|nr:efflux RND transporter periplasmic adaptor subunit [Vulcaniibacterium thermophilum]GHE29762.1 MexH family multidrug efflux RND transporter periplasmic adaptor subunit [Vulcaniibacterium thermophilum]